MEERKDIAHREPIGFSYKMLPFIGMHLVCLTAFITGISWSAVWLGVALYFIRMGFVAVGYHRYFSHRSFQTSRFFQFLLAFGGCTAAQKGPLWWGAHHRRHHKYTDTPLDPHSPLVWGFWYAHVGWILDTKWEHADLETMKDFSRFPEIRFLHRWHLLPPVLLALGCLFFFGWQGLVIGFFLSTVLLYHGTFSVNSLSHLWGTQPYDTGDGSRNNFFIALWTGGEGWHNNHHHCMSSAKQGFRWWQIDWGYYILKVLSWLKIVRKLRPAPA